MKKLVAILSVLLVALSAFTACSNKTTTEENKPASPTPSSPEESVSEVPTPSDPQSELPTEQSSPAPSSSPVLPTPTPSDEKKEGDPMTEEELGVLPVGQYIVTPVGTTTPISYAKEGEADDVNVASGLGGALNELTIVYQTHKDPYYLVFAGSDSMHVLGSPDRFYVNEGEDVVFRGKKYTSGSTTYYDDKRETLQWRIEKNEDGSYTFVINKDRSLCMSLKDGKLVFEKRESATGITSFNLEMKTRGGGDAFIQYISDEGNVVVRLEPGIKKASKATDEMLQTWANNLDDAYNHYIDLTTFTAHESIVVKGYEPSPHIGYVWNSLEHYNVITISASFLRTDLNKMATRWKKDGVVDWNFCALHEMGHMFDNQQPWYFEAEMMTDLKVGYVLQAGGGCAAPSEYSALQYFYADGIEGHAQIEECYLGLSAKKQPIAKSLEYGAYGAALKFIEIQREIDDENWTVYKQAYAELYKEGRTTYVNYEKFENFVAKLSKFSGKDVKALFTEKEWNVYMTKYGYTG